MALQFDPQILSEKVSAYFVQQSLFAGMMGLGMPSNGAMDAPSSFFNMFNELQGKDGDTVTVPFYAKLALAAEKMVAGTPLTPEVLADNKIAVTIAKYGKAVSINFNEKWKVNSSWQDEAARQIGNLLAQKLDDEALVILDSTAGIPGSVQVDHSTVSISYQKIQETLVAGFGDRFMEANVLIIHSAQHPTLLNDPKFVNADFTNAVGARTAQSIVGKIGNLFVIINDQISFTGAPGSEVYKNYICKPETVGLARKKMMDFEDDRDILKQQDILVSTLDAGLAPLHARYSADDKRAIELLIKA